jgi:hypothetical protein
MDASKNSDPCNCGFFSISKDTSNIRTLEEWKNEQPETLTTAEALAEAGIQVRAKTKQQL